MNLINFTNILKNFLSCLISRHDEYVLSRYKPKYSPAVFHTDLDMPPAQTQQFGVVLDKEGFNQD